MLTTHPAITAGLVDERTLREMVAAWHRWASDPTAFLARSFCEAIGWRNERHE